MEREIARYLQSTKQAHKNTALYITWVGYVWKKKMWLSFKLNLLMSRCMERDLGSRPSIKEIFTF